MNILKEKIFKIEGRYYNCRFWIPSENYNFKLHQELEEKFHELNGNYLSGDAEALSEYFCENYPINAVEVTTKQGTGSVMYVNWP